MTIPTLNQNQFAIQPVLGDIDLQFNGSVITGAVSASSASNLLPGQAVKLEDSAGGLPKFLPLTSNTDAVFGFVVRNLKDVSYPVGSNFEVAMKESVIWLVTGAAVARGASVEYDYAANSGNGAVIPSAGINPVVGLALDKASGSGQLIRVFLSTPAIGNAAGIFNTTVVATLAEINAGKTLIPAVAGKSITVTNYTARVAGAFASGTAVLLQSSNGTPVVVTTLAEAGLTNGAVLTPASANTTLGAGYAAALGAGDGLVVANSGSAQTVGTSITFNISYKVA